VSLNPTQPLLLHCDGVLDFDGVGLPTPFKFTNLMVMSASNGFQAEANATLDLVDALLCVFLVKVCFVDASVCCL
jgi:hypothetical protein